MAKLWLVEILLSFALLPQLVYAHKSAPPSIDCNAVYQATAEETQIPPPVAQAKTPAVEKSPHFAKSRMALTSTAKNLARWWNNPSGYYPGGRNQSEWSKWGARARRIILRPVHGNEMNEHTRWGGLLTEWRPPQYESLPKVLERPEKLGWFSLINPRKVARHYIDPPKWEHGALDPVDHLRQWLYRPLSYYANPRAILREFFVGPEKKFETLTDYAKEPLRLALYERSPLHYVNPLSYLQAPVRHLTQRYMKNPYSLVSPEAFRFHDSIPASTRYSFTPIKAIARQWAHGRNAVTRSLFGRSEAFSLFLAFPATWVAWEEAFEAVEEAEMRIDEWKKREVTEKNAEYFNALILFDVRYDFIREMLAENTLPLEGDWLTQKMRKRLGGDPVEQEARFIASKSTLFYNQFYELLSQVETLEPSEYRDLFLNDPMMGQILFPDINDWRTNGLPKKVEGYRIPQAVAGKTLSDEQLNALVKNALIRERKYVLVEALAQNPEEFNRLLDEGDFLTQEIATDPVIMNFHITLRNMENERGLPEGWHKRSLQELIREEHVLRANETLGITKLEVPYQTVTGETSGNAHQPASLSFERDRIQDNLERILSR